jgi:hypothetical protein
MRKRAEHHATMFGLGIGLLFLGLFVDVGSPAIAAPALPNDVGKFRTERAQCDHFRGEEANSSERTKFLSEQLQRYCAGTDARLRQLKQKYRGKRGIRRILDRFEPHIE